MSSSVKVVPFWLGDTVVFSRDKNDRYEGHDPFDDGTRLTVVDFERIFRGRNSGHRRGPGAFLNTHYPIVADSNGVRRSISADRVTPLSGATRRSVNTEDLKVGELPDTNFWEGDIVKTMDNRYGDDNGKNFRVRRIAYDFIDAPHANGITPRHIYDIEHANGFSIPANDDQISLVARGNFWRRAHALPLYFWDIKEESEFYMSAGECDDVRNPATGIFSFSLDQALDAIEIGEAHGFPGGTLSDRPFVVDGPLYLVRLWDETVGERMRRATLARFNRVPDESPKSAYRMGF